MIALHPEYIVDKHDHKKSVVLPFDEWEMLISDIEELDDIRAFDVAKSKDVVKFENIYDEIVQASKKNVAEIANMPATAVPCPSVSLGPDLLPVKSSVSRMASRKSG